MSYKKQNPKFFMNGKKNLKYEYCVFCGKPILVDEYTTDKTLFAHHAAPIIEGFCCGECNKKIVLPYRMKNHVGSTQNVRNANRFIKWILEGKNIFLE